MKISMAPLPTWKQLFSLLYTKTMNEQSLLRPWLRENDYAFLFSKSAWSLQAIVYWWEQVLQRKQPRVWLPDYFCNQSLTPLRETSAKISFYPIDAEFNPDWSAIEKMSVIPPDIFILVHYFGMAANAKSAKKFCKIHNTLLIEDAAHILKPFNGIGEYGDFVLYSPHKLLAMPDGAICVMRDSSTTYAKNAIAEMIKIQQAMQDKTIFPWKWLIKRIIQKIIPSYFYQSKSPDFYHESASVSLGLPKSTHLAKKLLQLHLSQLDKIIEKRKYLSAIWEYLLEKNTEIFTANMHKQIIPYLALFNGNDKTRLLYTELKNARWPVSTWPDLPREVSANTTAKKLRNSLFNLPVHHSLHTNYLIKKFNPYKNSGETYQIIQVINKDEWDRYFNQINKSNLLQSWMYGEAKSLANNWNAKRIFIKKNNVVIGLCQMLQKNILSLGSVTRINRGPLWLVDKPSAEDIVNAYTLIAKEFNVLKGKIALIAPGLTNQTRNQIILQTAKYHKRKTQAWNSAWINLSNSIEALRTMLDGKWRNQLKSAEKLQLSFRLNNSTESFENLIMQYLELQKKNGFAGIPVDLLRKMYGADKNNLFIAEILLNNEIIAGALIIKHGSSCTYTVGWTTDSGRKANAMNFLLWHTLLAMKEKNILWFDVGGIDEVHNQSIAKFKRGMNGEEYSLVGEYCV